MVELSEISYSRDAVVAAVRDYYRFLVDMYLDESHILEPPEGGWPNISSAWKRSQKTDEVISLLSHLPYLSAPEFLETHIAPGTEFADYRVQGDAADEDDHDDGGPGIRLLGEGDLVDRIPPHVVGLAAYGSYDFRFLLDTQLGIMYWPDCPTDIQSIDEHKEDGTIFRTDVVEQIEDDPYEWAPEEPEWRADGGIWAVEDFFELLKVHFRDLNFVPIRGLGKLVVEDIWLPKDARHEARLVAIQKIFRKHGWPDRARYRKQDCLAEIESYLEEWEADESGPNP